MPNRIEQVAGGIIVVDGLGSIVYSTDQRPLSNFGRVIRTIIGAGLILDGQRRE